MWGGSGIGVGWGGRRAGQRLVVKALFHNPVPSELRKIKKRRFSLVLRAKTGSWQGLGHRIVECCFNTGLVCLAELFTNQQVHAVLAARTHQPRRQVDARAHDSVLATVLSANTAAEGCAARHANHHFYRQSPPSKGSWAVGFSSWEVRNGPQPPFDVRTFDVRPAPRCTCVWGHGCCGLTTL